MARFSVVLVEHEPQSLQELRTRITAQDDFSVVAVAADGREAMEAIRRHRPDLLFLDIEMPRNGGLSGLQGIPVDHRPEIVFVTAPDAPEVAPYEVEALDYLLKPLDDVRVEACLERVRRRLRAAATARDPRQGDAPGAGGTRRRHLERFLARGRGGGSVVLGAERVDWLEADDNYVILHVGPERYRIRESLRNVEDRLDPRRFARVHRSVIVNLDRVREVRPVISGDFELILTSGDRVRLSRTFRRAFEERVRGLG